MKKIRNLVLFAGLMPLVLTGCATNQARVQSQPAALACTASADPNLDHYRDVGWTLRLPGDNP
jgi:hypothetical protein